MIFLSVLYICICSNMFIYCGWEWKLITTSSDAPLMAGNPAVTPVNLVSCSKTLYHEQGLIACSISTHAGWKGCGELTIYKLFSKAWVLFVKTLVFTLHPFLTDDIFLLIRLTHWIFLLIYIPSLTPFTGSHRTLCNYTQLDILYPFPTLDSP